MIDVIGICVDGESKQVGWLCDSSWAEAVPESFCPGCLLFFKTSTDAHTWALIYINENVKRFQLMSCKVLSIITALCYDC